MKINQKILSIPPYISTSWKNVVSMHKEDRGGPSILVIGLVNGSTIEIPNLDPNVLQATFIAHQDHLEQDALTPPPQKEQPMTPVSPQEMDTSALMSFPLNLSVGGEIGNLLQHSSEASDSPPLPQPLLEKVTEIIQAIGLDSFGDIPKPEPHCNCMHCQIMRSIYGAEESCEKEEEEEVTAEDLRFRDWEIKQAGDQLYTVLNPLNQQEQYNVFLGKPVGCTCGNGNCEHIRAVLNS